MANILSIDGGGIKGLFAASFLAELEEKCNVAMYEHFDLIAGTSTGGIIAAALATGIPANEIVTLYKEKANKIFSGNLIEKIGGMFFSSKYKTDTLQSELTHVFKETKIKDCKTRLLIPTYNLETRKVQVFKTPHAPDLYFDKDIEIVDCLLATTAAPTYFHPHKMERGSFIDGGVGANNPALIAVIEGLTRCNWKREELRLLSVGGIEDFKDATGGNEKMGLLDVKKIYKCFMNAESQYADNSTKLLLSAEKYVRVNYSALNGQVSLDKVNSTSLEVLESWGRHRAQEYINEIKTKFLENDKEEFKLYNILP